MRKIVLFFSKIAPTAAIFLLVPLFLSAQSTYFSDLINNQIIPVFRLLVFLFVALGIIVFLWGMVKYIASGGNETERTRAYQFMIWGIVGLFVMISVWGLVEILRQTIFTGQDLNQPGGLENLIPTS